MRTRCLTVVTALLVVAPAWGQDHGRPSLRLCGPAACTTVDDLETVERVAGFGQARAAAAPPLVPFFEVRVNPASWTTSARFFVPSAGVVRTRLTGRPAWAKIDRRTLRRLRVALRGVRPWPAPTLTYVRIDGIQIGAAPAYARLFEKFPPAPRAPYTLPRVHIDLGSSVPSPWTDGWHDIEYVTTRDLLSVDGRWVRPPADIVEQIEHDVSLLRRSPEDPASPWSAAAFALAVGAIALGVSFVRRRLRARAA